jgi:CRP-like cAMP-binding protein
MKERLNVRGGQLIYSGMPSTLPSRQDIQDYLHRLSIVSKDGSARIFDTRDSALEWMEDRILERAGWSPAESRPPLTLEEIPVFRDFDQQSLSEMKAVVELRTFEPGAEIFRVGGAGGEICFVRKGRVHILLPLEGGKRHHLATMCRGDFFGEMSFLDRGSRSAGAEAATRTELFVVSRSAFDEVGRHDHKLASRIFEQLALAIAQRLRVADAELRALEER